MHEKTGNTVDILGMMDYNGDVNGNINSPI